MVTILGLDISSTCTGFALLGVENNTIKLLEHGHFNPPSKDGYSLITRLYITTTYIEELCKRLKPDYTIVEEILQYMEGKTSANTIITLTAFNKTIALQVYKTTGKEPLFLLPVSIRTRIKKFLGREAKIEKEDIPEILQEYFGKSFFRIVGYKTRGKNKGQPIKSIYDEADAVAAAWAGLIEFELIGNNK